MLVYQDHKELFDSIVNNKRIKKDDELLSFFRPLRLMFQEEFIFWPQFSDHIMRVVSLYMQIEGIPAIHVLSPAVSMNKQGKPEAKTYTEREENHVFVATATIGDGIYYSFMLLGGPTLVDAYENYLGETLKPNSLPKLARLLSTSKQGAGLADLESSYFANYLPPACLDSARGYLDHSFYFDNVKLLHSGGWECGKTAKKLALYSLYYPQLSFWMKRIEAPAMMGLSAKNPGHLYEDVILQQLQFLTLLKPLIQSGAIFPVNIEMHTEEMMPTWVDYMTWLNYYYEARFLEIARKIDPEYQAQDCAEYMEVYAQAVVRSSLCSSHNLFRDELSFQLSIILADEGMMIPKCKLDEHSSAPILDKIILPILVDCEMNDIIAIRGSAEHLAAFRQDMASIASHMSNTIDNDTQATERIPRLARELVALRQDALIKDLSASSLRSNIKTSGFAFSLGLAVGVAVGNNPLSAITSGLISQCIALGVNRIRLKRQRRTTEALCRMYALLLDAPQ